MEGAGILSRPQRKASRLSVDAFLVSLGARERSTDLNNDARRRLGEGIASQSIRAFTKRGTPFLPCPLHAYPRAECLVCSKRCQTPPVPPRIRDARSRRAFRKRFASAVFRRSQIADAINPATNSAISPYAKRIRVSTVLPPSPTISSTEKSGTVPITMPLFRA